MIIAVEGMDYVGKSTQIRLLEKHFLDKKLPVLVIGSLQGKYREKFLEPETSPIERLFLGALSQREAGKKIEVFLEENPSGIVILDRWITSGYIYQVIGHGVPKEYWEVAYSQYIQPDYLICIHMDTNEYGKRVKAIAVSNPDRVESDTFEKELKSNDEFKARIQSGYEYLKNAPAEFYCHFDTTADEGAEQLSRRIISKVSK